MKKNKIKKGKMLYKTTMVYKDLMKIKKISLKLKNFKR